MECMIRNRLDLIKSISSKIHSLVEPLSQRFNIHTFGYRKFFPDGTSFNISNNFFWTKFSQENFGNHPISIYEDEVTSVLNGCKSHFFRIGIPDSKKPFLSALYNFDVWNTLSFYKKHGPCIEGFYFSSTRENHRIIEEYTNNFPLFERFSLFFKERFFDIISEEDLKRESSPTISPKVFEVNESLILKNQQEIKNFILETPIDKFLLNIDDKDVSLSSQEFKCLALLSQGKTAKEIGRELKLSPRTVESYIENIKRKTKPRSRGHLVDVFKMNFFKDKNLLNMY